MTTLIRLFFTLNVTSKYVNGLLDLYNIEYKYNDIGSKELQNQTI